MHTCTRTHTLVCRSELLVGLLQEAEQVLRHEKGPLGRSVVALQVFHCDTDTNS